jgi:hypothetical protein
LAVKGEDVATPLVLVTAVEGPVKLALAPLVGTANVTVTPLTGALLALSTVACRAVPNVVLIVVLCDIPAVAVILAGVWAVLVRLKLAGDAPVAVAVTV